MNGAQISPFKFIQPNVSFDSENRYKNDRVLELFLNDLNMSKITDQDFNEDQSEKKRQLQALETSILEEAVVSVEFFVVNFEMVNCFVFLEDLQHNTIMMQLFVVNLAT